MPDMIKGNQTMAIRFDGMVAIVIGTEIGLGLPHAMLLASRDAKSVMNAPGGSSTGLAERAQSR